MASPNKNDFMPLQKPLKPKPIAPQKPRTSKSTPPAPKSLDETPLHHFCLDLLKADCELEHARIQLTARADFFIRDCFSHIYKDKHKSLTEFMNFQR
jgi:hypothetical protein